MDELIRREKQSSPIRHNPRRNEQPGWRSASGALTTGGMPNAEARKAAKLGAKAIAAGVKGTLTGSLPFQTDDGRIFSDCRHSARPQAHAGLTSTDPQEGRSYGGGKSIVLLGDNGYPFIFSFAHGEGVYRLVHDRASLREVFGQAISDLTPISLRRWSMGFALEQAR